MVLKNIQKQDRKRKQAEKENRAYPEYATILSGESFFKIQQSERLTDCFMELALTSRVLIACRLSPMQKAEIIKLLKEYQPKKITLAIGDGVNDISMLNEADIGVSVISSNESDSFGEGGNHALNASAYSLGQFKQLRTLLLFHGRESYRKNAYLIYYSIYKNLLFIAPTFIFGIYSGFTGQNVYDNWLMQLYNIVFTSLPIILFGAMDTEYEKETLIKNPKLYEDGQTNALCNVKLFWHWFAYTVIQAALIFYGCFTSLLNAPEMYGPGKNQDELQLGLIQSGKTPDLVIIGSLLYFAVVLFVNLKLIHDSNSLSIPLIFLSLLSCVSFVGVFYGFSQLKESPLHLQFAHVWHYPQYSLCVLFFTLAMWPLNQILYLYFSHQTKEDRIQAIEDNSSKKEKHRREQAQQDLEERQQILKDQQRETMRGSISSASLGKYTQHTGFAFSGEEGHVPQILDNLKSYQ